MSKIEYLLIPYIALGFVLSLTLGIVYTCDGNELYYGSPVVFQLTSLGSSLTYYYSVYGIVINVLIWCVPIIAARVFILRMIKRKVSKALAKVYRVVVIVLLVFTTLNVLGAYLMMGNGFKPGDNYWYIDMDKDVETWKMKCEGEFVILG